MYLNLLEAHHYHNYNQMDILTYCYNYDNSKQLENRDLETGKLVDRFLTPDGGGIHGIEWDDGFMWVTGFNPKAIILVDTKTFSIVKKIPVNLDVLHGLARDGNGIWCADRKERVIVKFDVETGKEIDRITFPDEAPDPHGLSIKNQELWYSDAAFPDPRPSRDYPEIGKIRL